MIHVVSVVRDFDMYNRLVRNNPCLGGCVLTAYDNRFENVSIPKRYNDFIEAHAYEDDDWMVFCHEDFEFLENLQEKISSLRLNKDSIYGIAGPDFDGNPQGCTLNSRKDGSAIAVSGVPFEDKKIASTVDCMCVIVHSSCVLKCGLRFDSKLSFDLYVEDFCIQARERYGVLTFVIPIRTQHYSWGVIGDRFKLAYEYVARKYANLSTVYHTTLSRRIGNGCMDKEVPFECGLRHYMGLFLTRTTVDGYFELSFLRYRLCFYRKRVVDPIEWKHSNPQTIGRECQHDVRFLYSPTKNDFELWYNCSTFSADALDFRKLNGAVVVPGQDAGGGVWTDGRYLEDAMPTPWWWPERFWKAPVDVIDDESDAVYLGAFEPCWGHCFTDNLKFFWPFVCCPEKLAGRKLVYVTTRADKKLPENFWELLRFLGVDKHNLLKIDRPTRFRSLLLPDAAFFCRAKKTDVRYYTREYDKMIDCIISNVMGGRVPKAERKVYFSRTGWSMGNRDFGEERIVDVFRKKGYEIVSPEKLTFSKMVELLQECKEFAATEGSNAHNAVFLPKGTKVSIIKKCFWTTEYQFPINEMRELDVTYIDAHWTRFVRYRAAPYSGPFFLYVNDNLARWAGVKGSFPIGTFLHYLAVWAILRMGDYKDRALRKVRRLLLK